MFYFLSNTLYRAKKTLDFAQRQMDFPIPFSGSANFKGKTSIWNVYFRKCKKCFGCCNNSEEILKQHIIHSFSFKRHQHICLPINSLEYILNMFFYILMKRFVCLLRYTDVEKDKSIINITITYLNILYCCIGILKNVINCCKNFYFKV